jgi:hypothetical protein
MEREIYSDDFSEVVGDEVNGELDSPLRNHLVGRDGGEGD